MMRKSNVFSMMVIGVMVFALLKMPSATVNAAGKPPPKDSDSYTNSIGSNGNSGTGIVGGWRTSGTQILNPSNQPFLISGVNWYGFETRDNVAHGLWTKDYKYILDEVKQYGFNTVRIPFSNAMWESNPVLFLQQVECLP